MVQYDLGYRRRCPHARFISSRSQQRQAQQRRRIVGSAEHIERWVSEHHRDARAISVWRASRADAHRRLHHGFDHFLMA
jgi:hypothetical protein